MAVSSIAVPPDAKRDARARELVAHVATWPLFTLKQPHGSFPVGSQFRQATGSHGERYLANAVVCECCDYDRGNVCKHIRAVVLWEAGQEPAPAPRSRYEALFEGCLDCGDLADGLDGRCSKCASDREDQQRMAARRELVATA